MSWFAGYTGELNEKFEAVISHQNSFLTYNKKNIRLFTGGLKENLIVNPVNEGWIVSGIGIKTVPGNTRFTTAEEWKNILQKDVISVAELNGHYACIKWKEDEILLFNDVLGMREVYYYTDGSALFFSTRLDILALVKGDAEINYSALSGNWVLGFQLNYDCLVKDITRLGPGGRCLWKNKKITAVRQPWIPIPSLETSLEEKFVSSLNNIATFPLNENRNLSLGLSGGLDSRVLLESLLSAPKNNWIVHSFGSNEHPDVQTAKKIAGDKELKHIFIENEYPAEDFLIQNLYSFIGQLGLVTPASETIVYPSHKKIFDEGYIIIDGGMGEIHRREFLNKLLLLGKDAIRKKDINKLQDLFKMFKAPLFNSEIEKELQKEAYVQLENLLNESSGYEDLGMENWLDYLIVKYKTPNNAGPSQSLLDSLSIAYMPFIQPELLTISFAMDISQKKNSKLYKDIIRKGKNNLTDYPLVKSGIYYPFYANSLLMRVILKYRRKRKQFHYDSSVEIFLDHLKNYLLDTVNSMDFKDCSLYNSPEIKKWVEEYFYSGEKKNVTKINWWITFDTWRKALQIR